MEERSEIIESGFPKRLEHRSRLALKSIQNAIIFEGPESHFSVILGALGRLGCSVGRRGLSGRSWAPSGAALGRSWGPSWKSSWFPKGSHNGFEIDALKESN